MRYRFTTALRNTRIRVVNVTAAIVLTITGLGGGLPLILSSVAHALPTVSTVCASGCDYTDVQSAVNAANQGDTIQLNGDQSISTQITISKPLTLDGNGHTISPTFTSSSNSNNSSIGIDGTQDVTIANLTINGSAGISLHGINIYESTNVNLNNVTSENNDKDGVVVNGSTVSVTNLSTSGNSWGGIDVDQGSGVTDPAQLTIHAASYQQEVAAIVVDNITKNVLVTDTDSQYTYTNFGNLRIYTQIPTGIANLSPADGTYTTTAGLTMITWHAATSPHGPLTYYYESSHSNSVNSYGSFASPVYGPAPVGANTYISTSGTPAGIYYWHVRAKDSLDNYSAWTTPWKITVDNTAPSTPAITAPTNGQYFKYTPIVDSWTASSDSLSGVDHYQVAYLYDDHHTFGGSTCLGVMIGGQSLSGCRDTTSTSRNHMPGINEQGGITIWVRAFDKSGNASDWSSPVHYFYYAIPPAVPSATMKDANGNPVSDNGYINTISPNFTFNLSDSSSNVAYYQLKYWNDIPGDPYNGETHAWISGNLSTAGHMSTLGIYTDLFTRGEGTHYFKFSACYAANNCSDYSAPFTVIYDKTAPVITDTTFTINMLTGDKVTLNPTVTDASPVTYKWQVSDSKLLNNPLDTLDGASLAIGPAPKGTYTVTLVVTDAAHNATTVTYNVTINTPAENNEQHNAAPTNPQVLGATTSNNNNGGNGQVLGDSTTTPPTTTPTPANMDNSQPKGNGTVDIANASNKASNAFLGLGWWWLALLGAAILGFLLFLFGRSANNDKPKA